MRGLSPDELARFRTDGFVILPDVLTPKRLRMLREATEAMVTARERYRERHPERVAEMAAAEARGEVIHATEWTHVVMQMYQLWERHQPMRAHSLDPELAELARTALGARRLRLWFDQVMIKEPGDGPTPFHQDNTYLPMDRAPGGVVTIWAPLTSVTADMGCLRYLPGSHRGPLLAPVPLRELHDIAGLLDEPACLDRSVPAEVPAGGVVMHHGDVIHGAGPNTAGRPRVAVLTCYFPDGSRRDGQLRQYVIDRDRVAVGRPLAGPGLPVVAPGHLAGQVPPAQVGPA